MNKKKLTVTIGLSSILLLTGCGNGGNKANANTSNSTNNAAAEQTTNSNVSANKNATVTETAEKAAEAPTLQKEEAYDKFLEAHKDATVTAFELTEENGTPVYQVNGNDGESEFEVEINSEDGSIIREDKEMLEADDKNKQEITKDMLAKIDEFIDKADKEVEDGYVINEYSLESDDGRLIVDLEYINGTNDISFEYDFESGEVIEQDM